MLSRLYVPFGFWACSVCSHTIQLILPNVSFHGLGIFRSGTTFPQMASGTDLIGSLVLLVVSHLVIASSSQFVPGWKGEGVRLRIV